MKIAIVCFSYKKDEELLWYTSKAHLFFNKNHEYDINFYLINDKNNPVEKIPENFIVINSEVDRGTNICGLPFIKEQYKIYKDIADTGKYDFLVKVDSDTWVFNLDRIKDINKDEICEAGQIFSDNGYNVVSGPCQILTIPAVKQLYNTIQNRKELVKLQIKMNRKFPEDNIKSYILKDFKQILLCQSQKDKTFAYTFKKFINPELFSDIKQYRKIQDNERTKAIIEIKNFYNSLNV